MHEKEDQIVGGTQRADGSIRRTVKVRPGYTPPEQQAVYNVSEVVARRRREREEAQQRRTNFESNNQENSGVKDNGEKILRPDSRSRRSRFSHINSILASSSQSPTPTPSTSNSRLGSARSNNKARDFSNDKDVELLSSNFDQVTLDDEKFESNQRSNFYEQKRIGPPVPSQHQYHDKQKPNKTKDHETKDNFSSKQRITGAKSQSNRKHQPRRKFTLEELEKQVELRNDSRDV